MSDKITNIYTTQMETRQSVRGESDWRCLDISGEHLGVRVMAVFDCAVNLTTGPGVF
jgi:hypothetical protein